MARPMAAPAPTLAWIARNRHRRLRVRPDEASAQPAQAWRRRRRFPVARGARGRRDVSRPDGPSFREHPAGGRAVGGAGGNRTPVRRAVTVLATTIPETAA